MEDFTLGENQPANAIAVFDTPSKSIQAFHPENKTWTTVHGVTDEIAKKDFRTVAFHGTVYVLASDKTNYKLKYADPNASWTRLPDRPVTDKVLAVILNDFLYSFGGINGTGNMNDAVRFDPIAMTWHHLPVMPTARRGAAAVELNGKIYVIGGCANPNYLDTVECFNIQSEIWAAMKPTNGVHCHFNACVIDGKIYAVGGQQSPNSIEEYDETLNSWNTVDTMPGKSIKRRATFSLHVQDSH